MLGRLWMFFLQIFAGKINSYAQNLFFKNRQRGASVTEFLVASLALLPLALGGIQAGLIYNAKSVLNQATFESARIGAVNNAQSGAMEEELARRLAGFYGATSKGFDLEKAYFKAIEDIKKPATGTSASGSGTKISILNPTQEAFSDFGVTIAGQLQIPNDHLRHRSTSIGSNSKVNIQDANLLKIQVTYGYRMFVPVAGQAIGAILALADPANAHYYNANPPRLPIVSTAVVRMQSPAYPDNNVSIGTGGGGGAVDPGDSGGGPSDPGQGGNDGDNGANEPGFSSGTDDSFVDSDPPGSGPVTNPPADEEPKCEGENYSDGDSLVGVMLDTGRFLSGVIDGLVQQAQDLWSVISDMPGTFDSIINLVQAMIDDPAGTLKAIVDAFAEDVKKFIHCGPYDQGKALGEYVSPGVLLKLGTKLAKFGGNLDSAINEVKKDFGCASFAVGTPVLTPQGILPIQSIIEGQLVLSRSDVSMLDRDQRVTRVFSRTAPGYWLIETESYEYIQVTEEHPVWVQGQGWTEARNVKAGDAIATSSGDVAVTSSSFHDEPIEVYNFAVDHTPSYFVGLDGLWVHNSECGLGSLKRKDGAKGLKERCAKACKPIDGLKEALAKLGMDPSIRLPEGWAAHHLMPVKAIEKAMKSNAAVKEMIEKAVELGFDIDSPRNGIGLPTSLDDPLYKEIVSANPDVTPPLHLSNHTSEGLRYEQALREELVDLAENWKDMPPDNLVTEMYKISDKMKEKLYKREICLTYKDPLCPYEKPSK